jgi:peptidoglycan hydrolase-like protein with peptidoglycan-binding domain
VSTSPLTPARRFRYTLREGIRGHDVAALQLNLNDAGLRLAIDGDFGPLTFTAVKLYQDRRGTLHDDGIAGPVTQRHLALELMRPAQRDHRIPNGLLRGIVEGESGFFVGAVNWSVPGGVDCGWTQRRLAPDAPDEELRAAFSGRHSFGRVAAELRERKDTYYGRKAVQTHQRAWELAVLHHNWPAAAMSLAVGGTLSNQPAGWVTAIGVPGVTTPAQWADYYVARAMVYVRTYSA